MQSGLGPMQGVLTSPISPARINHLAHLNTASQPFLPLRPGENRIRHQAVPDRDQAALSSPRGPIEDTAILGRPARVDCRWQIQHRRHQLLLMGQLGRVGRCVPSPSPSGSLETNRRQVLTPRRILKSRSGCMLSRSAQRSQRESTSLSNSK